MKRGPYKETAILDSEYIKGFLKEHGFVQRNVSLKMGYHSNYLADCLNKKAMRKRDLTFLCLLTGMDEKDATIVKQEKTNDQVANDENCEIIVSYIQDIGKIQTELLRTIKEEHEEIMKTMSEIMETLKDFKVEGHKDNQLLLNYFKYGRK